MQAAQVKNGAAPNAASKSRLGMASKGQLKSAKAFLFYGPEGVGKSSLAADSDAPIFLDIEGGADNIDVTRYVFRDEPRGHVPRSYGEVLDALDDIATAEHAYKTLVVDTVDALEALVHRFVCQRATAEKKEKITSIEDFGYGRGYQVALDEFRLLTQKLDRLKARGMTVLLLGHSSIKTFKNPLGPDYDRWQLRLNDKAAGQLKEWCDVVGFLRFDEIAAQKDSRDRPRGFSKGQRLVSLHKEAAWDAKTRLPLPNEIVLDSQNPFAPFAIALAGIDSKTDDEIRAEIDAELARIGDVVAKPDGSTVSASEVRAKCAGANRSQLMRALGALKETQSTKSEKGE